MKNLSNNRMESIVITMNSLQQKYGGVKFRAITDLMESTPSSMTMALTELRKRNLVIKEGRGKEAIYKVTKAASESISNNTLDKFIASNKVAQPDKIVALIKRYNKTAKENIQLKKELNQTKKLSIFDRLKNLFK